MIYSYRVREALKTAENPLQLLKKAEQRHWRTEHAPTGYVCCIIQNSHMFSRWKTHHGVRVIGGNCGYDGSLNSIGSNHASVMGLFEHWRKVIHVLQRKEIQKKKYKKWIELSQFIKKTILLCSYIKWRFFWSPLFVKRTLPFISFVQDLNEVGKKTAAFFQKERTLTGERKNGSESEELTKNHKCV